MSSDKKTLYVFSLSLLLVLSLLLFCSFSYLKIVLAIILGIGAFIIFKFLKKRKTISINTSSVVIITTISSITFVMGYYLLGINFGFYRSNYQFSFVNLLFYIIPIGASIFAFEYIRTALLSYENKLVNSLIFISGVIVEILLVSALTAISGFNQVMDMIALTFVPAIVSNVLYNYLAKSYGFLPNMTYRLVISLYMYLIPFVPNVPESLYSLMKLVVPLILMFIIKVLFEKEKKKALEKKNTWAYVVYGLVFASVLSTTLIFSNQFSYGAVVIATESMTGELNKGDIVFYKKYEGETISEKEIILFTEDEALMVHRVVEIIDINGELRYYTKGDFNEDRDSGYRVSDDIVGKTTLKLPYVGYITLWLRELVND